MKRPVLITVLSLIILGACVTSKKISYLNLAYLYDAKKKLIEVEYTMFHQSDTLSTVYFKVNLMDLLYKKLTETGGFNARFKIKYELYDSYDAKILIDSSTTFFSDSLNYGEIKDYIGSFNCKVKYQGNYILFITFFDRNKKMSVSSYLDVYKTDNNSRQYYLVLKQNGTPLFNNSISENERVKILCSDSEASIINVRYYFRKFPLAQPPYTVNKEVKFHYNADSLFAIPVKNKVTESFSLPKIGFYHFQIKTDSREGITLFRYYYDFPQVRTPKHALLSIRYLTTKKEYDKMVLNKDKKRAVDEFWLQIAGNPQRATSLISKYYNNVQDANRYFSSYLEGWKTDRGLIYIVYGPPDIIYRTDFSESWTYGEKGNSLSINFIFMKVKNPFCDNDYILKREPKFKEGWFHAVDTWRR